ncbi:MAG: F0F1 ATP synthase subunit epsilon [Rhizobiales bacterium]|nr:F0F1 ATP synthase subunit epsilon [Hyphomicrobiales bacterium]
MAEAFTFELVSPERLIFSGNATEVVVPGTEGYFTVMKNHAPFMSTVKPGVVEATLDSGDAMKVFVRGGLADVSPSGFTLLAEIAVPVGDLTTAMIDREIANAREDLSLANDDKRQSAQERVDQLNEVKSSLGL